MDPQRNMGIRLRHADGSKTCWAGSRLGLVFPNFGQKGNPPELADPLLVPEGESAAAAALDLGFTAIGRPGCGVCAADVLAHVGITRLPRVVLLADSDEPGQRGAHALARRIATAGHPCRVLTLPDGAKDLRAWKLLPESNHQALAALIDAPAYQTKDCNDNTQPPAVGVDYLPAFTPGTPADYWPELVRQHHDGAKFQNKTPRRRCVACGAAIPRSAADPAGSPRAGRPGSNARN